MIEEPGRRDGPDERVVDYSDPAQLPSENPPRRRSRASGGFILAGFAAGLVIVAIFVAFGYVTNYVAVQPQPVQDSQAGDGAAADDSQAQ